jgi:SAM-dependent methyltransferase
MMHDPTTTQALTGKYEAIAYDALPQPLTHPSHVAAIMAMFGFDTPPVTTARVLEIGCNDGSNLVPMAASLPRASFIGYDVAPSAIRAARAAAEALGIANASFVEADLASIDDGPFDYVIAHGIYSWVGAPVRDALFALAARALAPNGIAFVSYNTHPGGHIRRAAALPLLWHVRAIADPRERVAAARGLAALLAEPGPTAEAADAALRAEWKRIAEEADSALFHDSIGEPSEPVWFHEFVAHAARHGLAYVAEALPSMMTGGGLGPRMRQFLASRNRLDREQYLDFARVRRFRQSLLCRADPARDFEFAPARLEGLYVSASAPLVRSAAESRIPTIPGPDGAVLRRLLDGLVAVAPEAIAVGTLLERTRDAFPPSGVRPATAILLDAWLGGFAQLHAVPPKVTSTVEAQPLAAPVARWQATRRETVTNLRHEAVKLTDPFLRALLPLCDGTRSSRDLARALAGARDAGDPVLAAQIEDALASFGRLGLLSGQ